MGSGTEPVALPTAAEFLEPKVVVPSADAPKWPNSRVRFSEELVASTAELTLTESNMTVPSRRSVVEEDSIGYLRTNCFCGAVTLSVNLSFDTVSASVCHCNHCRRLSGAPFNCNVVLPKAAIEILVNVEDTLQVLLDQRTSRGVVRRRCAKCFSPLLATLGSERIVIPAALFSRPHPPSWAMHHHIWYSQRVMEVYDGLPKYVGNFGEEQCTDSGEPLNQVNNDGSNCSHQSHEESPSQKNDVES